MEQGVLKITEKRLNKLKRALSDLLQQYEKGMKYFKVRSLACIVGQIISTQAVSGDLARLRSRFMYDCILTRECWNSSVVFSLEAVNECRFWLDNIEKINEIGSQLCQLTYNEVQDFHVFCDASETGFGGHLTTGSEDEPIEIYGSWSSTERVKSSTWRELESVKRVLRNLVIKLHGATIRVYTDNKNVPHIMKVGSKKKELHRSVMSVHKICQDNKIKLNLVWIPREHNDKADSLSRKSDCDDWEIDDWIFTYLNKLWGPYTFDRFAQDYNAKCNKFNSKFWCTGTSGINAFSVSWDGENNWLVPPPRLVPHTINKMIQDKGSHTLIVPEWTSAAYWPMLVDQEGRFKSFIRDYRFFQGESLTKRGRGQNGIFGSQFLKFRLVAINVK